MTLSLCGVDLVPGTTVKFPPTLSLPSSLKASLLNPGPLWYFLGEVHNITWALKRHGFYMAGSRPGPEPRHYDLTSV